MSERCREHPWSGAAQRIQPMEGGIIGTPPGFRLGGKQLHPPKWSHRRTSALQQCGQTNSRAGSCSSADVPFRELGSSLNRKYTPGPATCVCRRTVCGLFADYMEWPMMLISPQVCISCSVQQANNTPREHIQSWKTPRIPEWAVPAHWHQATASQLRNTVPSSRLWILSFECSSMKEMLWIEPTTGLLLEVQP